MRLARDALCERGWAWRGGGWCRVIRTVDHGLDPSDETWAPVPPAATTVVVCDTPAGYRENPAPGPVWVVVA